MQNVTLHFFHILPALAALTFGCAAPPAKINNYEVRQQWANDWISASSNHLLKECYKQLRTRSINAVRGDEFGRFSAQLMLEVTARPLSGSQLLDLLGTPDSIKTASSHSLLKYYFREDKTLRSHIMIIILDNGMVTQIGWN